ncbi:methionyl-tRNA formyltransferase [Candidatus Daviesbacteria bacterium]|nr:methionyl-tRNA formyltransferase [Candidatus Daviesbacteria bacterium]
MTIIFLGTPDFVQPIKDELAKHFTLVNSLSESDLAVVAAYGKILTKMELNTPKYGCINVHPSLLPKYRGPSPIQSAILNGDKISGISIIKIDEEVDHGTIIYQEQLELSDSDNFDILSKKMFARAAEILPQIIEDFIQDKIKPVAQNHKLATYCKELKKEDGYFEIDNPPEDLDRKIRAYYPWPGVWCRWKMDNGQLKIVKFLPGNKIQMEGKKVMPLKNFLNGYPNFPLKKLSWKKH